MLSVSVHGGERSLIRLPSNRHCRWTRALRHNEIPGPIPHLTAPTMGECMTYWETSHSSANGGCITNFASTIFIILSLLMGVHILQQHVFTSNIVLYVNKINYQDKYRFWASWHGNKREIKSASCHICEPGALALRHCVLSALVLYERKNRWFSKRLSQYIRGRRLK
jgi:hypothetical protein